MRWSLRRAGVLVSTVLTLTAIGISAPPVATAAVAQLPFTVTNNSGRADATYIYVVARSNGQQGYVDGGGAWHAYPFPSSIPPGQPNPAAPDVSIPGPATGTSKTITLPPSLAGGRIYFSMGAKLQFFMTANGLVEPAPWVASDPNANTLYDWTEFARASNGGTGIFINSTTVDMFSLPMSVRVTGANGATQTEGITAGRSTVLSGINALGGDWARLQQTRASDGLALRALAPIHAIGNGAFSSTYLDAYIAAAWTYYQSHTLTVDTAWGPFTGTVSGTGMIVRNTSGGLVGTIPRPSTSDVFGCSGAIQPGGQPDTPGILAFGARVCAGFHRATLSTASRVMFDHQPTTDASRFYQQTASDLYSKVIHANSLNGRAYGFAYDDVAAFAPTIDQSDPTSAGMTIASFGGGTTPPTDPPTNPAGATQINGPGGKCVDVAGDNTGTNNAPVQLWACQGTVATDQQWTWNGTTLRTLGRCLDVTAGSTANLAQLQLYDCNGTGAQNWQQVGNTLRNPASGRCIDSPSGNTANGTRLQIYDCNGTGAQYFVKAA